MNATSTILMMLAIVAGVILYRQNPDPRTISFFMLEITATTGVLCVSALGLGILTGVLAMMTPRMRLPGRADSGT